MSQITKNLVPERLGTNVGISPYWYHYIDEYLDFLDNPVKVDFNTPIDDALNNIQLLFQTLNDTQIYELANDSNITLGMLEPTQFPRRSAWAADCGNILSNYPVSQQAYRRVLED